MQFFSALRAVGITQDYPDALFLTVTMGKKNNDWTKKLKGTSQRKLEALEKKVRDRKQRVAQLEERARQAAVIEAMRQRCVRLANEVEIKFEKYLVKKWGR